MPNQSTSSANIVPKGTAPDDFSPHTKKLSVKKIEKMTPVKRHDVSKMFFFHSTCE